MIFVDNNNNKKIYKKWRKNTKTNSNYFFYKFTERKQFFFFLSLPSQRCSWKYLLQFLFYFILSLLWAAVALSHCVLEDNKKNCCIICCHSREDMCVPHMKPDLEGGMNTAENSKPSTNEKHNEKRPKLATSKKRLKALVLLGSNPVQDIWSRSGDVRPSIWRESLI